MKEMDKKNVRYFPLFSMPVHIGTFFHCLLIGLRPVFCTFSWIHDCFAGGLERDKIFLSVHNFFLKNNISDLCDTPEVNFEK